MATEHKIGVFGQTKTHQVGHLSEQRHVWSVMLLCAQPLDIN